MTIEPPDNSSKLTKSPVMTPLRSLILSTTRPATTQRKDATDCISTPSYIILFQQTYSLRHRVIAAEPTINSAPTTNRPKSKRHTRSNDTNTSTLISERDIYQNAGLMPPKETSQKMLLGTLLVQSLLLEFIDRCNGCVILVSCIGNTFEYDQDGRFQRNGVIVDLHSDPFGWDDDCDNDDAPGSDSIKTIKAQSGKLKSIMERIKMAAAMISDRRHSNASNNKMQQEITSSADDELCQQDEPIPIIFDSITPLLLYHGIDKIMRFMSHLKNLSSPISLNKIPVAGDKSKHYRRLSPVFLPVTTEVLTPSQNRTFEDASDAVLSFNQGQLFIAKRSARNGGMISNNFGSGGTRLVKEVQDIVDERNCDLNKATSFNIESSSPPEQDAYNPPTTNIGASSKNRKNPVLVHETEGISRKVPIKEPTTRDEVVKEAANKPRIYFEQNDPEFEDFDEEDPDDDLDI